jgi:uncharacterized protein YbbK (DUF523 family)/uncharacterized protein YbgA (DUF1722 family)
MTPRVPVGVSACLIGQPVRYDGGHKRDDILIDRLGAFVRFVPVCPEVEMGLGTPRETLRLVRRGDENRLIMANGEDHTATMRAYARQRVDELAGEELCGYVLKRRSPSCGLSDLAVYDEETVVARDGRGLFADALVTRWPNLPVVEESGLLAEDELEHFLERVQALGRWRALGRTAWSIGDLVAFHTTHKLVLRAHSLSRYRELGRLVASGAQYERRALADEYEAQFMAAMAQPATRKTHADALSHAMGHLRGRIDETSRAVAIDLIEQFRLGRVPLGDPLACLRECASRGGVTYLEGQVYLERRPIEPLARPSA